MGTFASSTNARDASDLMLAEARTAEKPYVDAPRL